jgi:hypothetical protein
MSTGRVEGSGDPGIRTWLLGAASAALSGVTVVVVEKRQWIWLVALALAAVVTMLYDSLRRSAVRKRKIFGFLATGVALGLVLTLGVMGMWSDSNRQRAAADPGTDGCSTTSLNGGGKICIDSDQKGYRAIYVAGDDARGDSMDLNLVCDNGRWFGDDGAFPAHANRTYTYVFAVGSQGTCHVTLFNRSRGGETGSPSVTR